MKNIATRFVLSVLNAPKYLCGQDSAPDSMHELTVCGTLGPLAVFNETGREEGKEKEGRKREMEKSEGRECEEWSESGHEQKIWPRSWTTAGNKFHFYVTFLCKRLTGVSICF